VREIVLNSKRYQITGEIVQRAINPWQAKVQSGGLTYEDFGQAQLEEYYDFRNGIGKKRGLGSEARLEFSEGIDFTTEGQAVLGGLVNTAGTFGVAPVKIIDFQDATYAIGLNLIAKWNTGTSAWDTKWQNLEICDCDAVWDAQSNVTCSADTSDKKEGTASAKIVVADAKTAGTLATESITAVDLSGETEIKLWIKSSIALNADDLALVLNAGGVTKEDIGIGAISADTWTKVTLTLADPSQDTAIDEVFLDMDVDKGAFTVWLDHITGGESLLTPIDAIVATDATDEYFVVSSADDAIYSTDGITWLELTGCQGYLAWYDTKLRGIDTDGGTVRSSAANNIDGTWTTFDLSGQFGTVYDLFEGKLLADGTPTLYFCGTEGLFTIDVTNEKAYKQEVEYPPLTYAGHKGMYWNANVWVATGFGILKVTPSMATFIGPDLDDGLPSGYQGSIFDMVTVNNWLVYCVNKTTSSDRSSILKRNASYGGNLQVYTSAADTAITCLHHSPSSLYTNGRLWFGEGTNVKYMMFPDTTSNVKQISTYEYVDDSGYGKLPIFRKLAVIPKVALGVGAITKSCDADDYIEVFYGLNGAAPTTSLGTFKTSPRPTILTFNSGLGTEFYTIQFAIKLFRDGGTTTSPELESLLFYYYAVPDRISAWTFNVEAIGDEADRIFSEFETILDTKTLVAFVPSGDTNKSSYNVKLTSMPSRAWWEEMGGREGYFQVTCEELCKL